MEDALKALAHPQRRELLRLVLEGERNATELAEASGLRQPTASQHLKVLREAELVSVRVHGNQRLYSVNFERALALRSFFDSLWGDHLDRLKRAAENTARPRKARARRKRGR